jgi:hypothetical protein
LVPLTWHSGVLLERDDAYPYAAQSAPPTGSAADAKAFASYIRKTRRPLFRR